MTTNSDIDTYKAIASTFFAIVLFLIVPILMSVGINKRKLILYADQIRNAGLIIDQFGFLSLLFDRKTFSCIFNKIPPGSRLPNVSDIKMIMRLQEKIQVLAIIATQITIALCVGTITLLVLMSIF